MNESTSTTKIAYVGPAGAGMGFQLSGMTTQECSSGEEMIAILKSLKQDKSYAIIFVDEGLAEMHLDALSKLNADPLPAILLLPNPFNPKNVTATSLKNLIIKAVGSDIFAEK